MSASSDLERGDVAYDGYHALDPEYTPFNELPRDEQWRWAQAACNAGDAWVKPEGVDAEHWRTSTRAAHAHLRLGIPRSQHSRLLQGIELLIEHYGKDHDCGERLTALLDELRKS